MADILPLSAILLNNVRKNSGALTQDVLNQPNGVPQLGSDGKLPNGVLPSQLITAGVSLAAPNVDWSSGGVFDYIVTSPVAMTFENALPGMSVTIAITSNGANAVTWPANVKWPGGVAPQQTADGTDVYTFVNIGGTIYGSAVTGMA